MIQPDKPVRVFKNWKHGCYSIMQDGRLKASARQVRLAEVEFRVRPSGRRRMLEKGQRTLHAYAIGRLVDYVHPDEARDLAVLSGRGAYYDPHRFPAFVDSETHEPVNFAGAVQLDEAGVTYADPDSACVARHPRRLTGISPAGQKKAALSGRLL